MCWSSLQDSISPLCIIALFGVTYLSGNCVSSSRHEKITLCSSCASIFRECAIGTCTCCMRSDTNEHSEENKMKHSGAPTWSFDISPWFCVGRKIHLRTRFFLFCFFLNLMKLTQQINNVGKHRAINYDSQSDRLHFDKSMRSRSRHMSSSLV